MSGRNSEIYSINWYPKESPEINEIVVARKVSIDDMGVWVDLIEYSGKKGFIPLAYATKSNKAAPKTIKIGKVVFASVYQVDPEKKNIDLTRRYLPEEDVLNAKKRFKNYKNIMKLLLYITHTAKHMQFQEIVQNVLYPLHLKYESASIALKKSYYQPEIINDLSIPIVIKQTLIDQVSKLYAQSEVRVRTLFEAEIFKPEGVELLRDALVSGYEVEKEIDEESKNKKSNLSITVISPPIYCISIDVYNAEKGYEYVNKALQKIEQKLQEYGGRFLIREKPKVQKKSDLVKYQTKSDEISADSDELNEEF